MECLVAVGLCRRLQMTSEARSSYFTLHAEDAAAFQEHKNSGEVNHRGIKSQNIPHRGLNETLQGPVDQEDFRSSKVHVSTHDLWK